MKKTGFIAGAIVLGIGAFVLFTFVVMWLWNWLMPEVFSLGIVTFWQAAGLLVLSKILFSGTDHGHHWHSDRRKKYWRTRFEEKWKGIPEEKKDEFIQKMHSKGFSKNSETE
jgi:hypothetical protein